MLIFIRQNFSHPPKVFLNQTLNVELPKNLVICFKGNLASLIARNYKSSPQLCTSFEFKATNFTVATETANNYKPPETAQKHLQAPKTIHNYPKSSTKNICNHPKPAITTRNHPQSARIYLELAITGDKPSISMLEHPQSLTKYLRPTPVFM